MIEPRSEVVPLAGLEFHYLDWGDRDAPPVLFLHGFAGHAWQTIFPAQVLAADHWVIALDQRGHGDSGPPPNGEDGRNVNLRPSSVMYDARGHSDSFGCGKSMTGRFVWATGSWPLAIPSASATA